MSWEMRKHYSSARYYHFLQGLCCAMSELLSVYKDGQAKLNGYLDDYAFLAAALLDAF